MKIGKIKAREILDSRGMPTIEVEVTLENGSKGVASVPSGASTGEHEAIELRDKDESRYNGNGVTKAIENIDKRIAPHIIGCCVFEQREIDRIMIDIDNSRNKSNLGANAMLGVSLAVAHAAANALNTPLYRYIGGVNAHILPVPMMNIINGGRHSSAPIAFQEFMIRPIGASSIKEALRIGSEIFSKLKRLLRNRGLSTAVGDEGGFAPEFVSIEDVIETILLAVDNAGYVAGKDIDIALDCAASEFFHDDKYNYGTFQNDGKVLTREEQVEYLNNLINCYPIASIEDGMSENDWAGWRMLTERIGDKCQLVGDDLFVTNSEFLKRGIEKRCGNSILIKPNQIGTLTETLDTIELARNNGYRTIISHRSGETEDTTIADIAVAMNAGEIKTGSMSRGERIAKYNRLIRIEESLGKNALYGKCSIKKH